MHDHDSAQMTPTLPAGLPDGWLFDRDLNCPECSYNLRMLSQPQCPECGTVFRWQTLLHVGCPRCGEGLETIDDGQCPRCGLELNWEKLLGEADPALHRHFEYTTKPIRTIIPTWFAALRPARFWRRIPLESPPAVTRLRWLWRIALIVPVLALIVALLCTWGAPIRMFPWIEILWYVVVPCIAVLLALPFVTFLALPMFAPTLSKFRVRREQLRRLQAYGVSGNVFAAAVLLAAGIVSWVANSALQYRLDLWPAMACAKWFVPYNAMRWDPTNFLFATIWFNTFVGAMIHVLVFAWWWRFLYVGLHHYLRFDTRNTIALLASTQAIGLLVMLLLIHNLEVTYVIGQLVHWLSG